MIKVDYYAAKGGPRFGDLRDQPGMVLGWKGARGQCAGVPGTAWLHPATSGVAQIEDAHGHMVPRPKIVPETVIGYGGQWLYETSFGFEETDQDLSGWSAKWEFEDGATVSALHGTRVLSNPKPQLIKVSLIPLVSSTSIAAIPLSPLMLATRVIFPERVLKASIHEPADVRRYAALMDADTLSQLTPASVAARLAFLNEWGTDQQITKFSDALPDQERMLNDPAIAAAWVNARIVAIRTHAVENPAKAISDLQLLEPRIRQRFPPLAEPLEIDLRVIYLRDPECAGRLGQIAFQYPNSNLAKIARIRVGDLYRLLGRYKDAIAQYQAVGINADDRSLPAQDRAYSITINDLITNNYREEAMAKLTEWEMKHPMAKFDSDFLLLRARVLMFFGRWNEATLELESFQKVQPESPNQIDAEFLRARVLYERNAKDEARKIWTALAKNYPKHPLAKEAASWAAKP